MDIVFTFPGQGSQSIGMGASLVEAFPEAAKTLQEASDILGYDMQELCLKDPQNQLGLTEFTQPALLALSTATVRVLRTEIPHLHCAFVAGHSLGEYSALVALGALSFSDALKAVRFRGQAMQRAVPVGVGAMAAYLGTESERIFALCQELSKPGFMVEVANDNCPGQIVLSGHKEAVEKACTVITEQQLGRSKMLPVSAPFHSSLMLPAAKEMEDYLKQITLHHFEGSLIANIDAQVHTAASYTKDMLVRQLRQAVLWTQSLRTLATVVPATALWIEVGPGKVLQGLGKKTLQAVEFFGTAEVADIEKILSKVSDHG